MNDIKKIIFLDINNDYLVINNFDNSENKVLKQTKFKLLDKIENELNLEVLSRFFLEKIKIFEKDIGVFINNVNVILSSNNTEFVSSIRKNYNNTTLTKKLIIQNIENLRQTFIKNNKKFEIIHILINKIAIDKKELKDITKEMIFNEIIIELKFICFDKRYVKKIRDILKNCNIDVSRILCQNYIKEFMQVNDSNILIAANKVAKGINKFEVFVEEKSSKKLGFFEKLFHYFTR